ncbi:MAG TPA: tRNA preQ1(34) S-adenosylmethionine ribosyltransferase-isomerase QueA [Burkholderiales bacterium]|nr:tRNA preQ1(34) S-adenosylmethionine ribosyltransferase-isomerase QueA [Burkholderiales bacterium]
MKLSDFDYHLPEELIAKNPLSNRSDSRLLVVNEHLEDHNFSEIINYINPGDLLIRNDTRVVKARIFGHKPSGGKVEVMLERIIDQQHFIAHVRTSKRINIGMEIILPDDLVVTVSETLDGLFALQTRTPIDLYAYLEHHGNLPLPPYMQRQAEIADESRYQTVYAAHNGSVAAPTAGLHFTPELLAQIEAKGAQIASVTLHVGSGTFKPVSVENISEHKMHSEVFQINETTIELIKQAKARGGKIIAVGTTSLRTLESVAKRGLHAQSGETDIFITPGFKFQLVDKLITNFHLPKSTLLMLVSAFSGKNKIDMAYQYAIKNNYRFFSYGDAMLLTRQD